MRCRSISVPALLVIATAVVIAAVFAWATYYINYWPSDSYSPYIPTARKLFTLPYISEMHRIQETEYTSLNMRGKETLILGIAVMQKLLGDPETLYPNVLLLILAVCVASISLYVIMAKLFDPPTGVFVFGLFTFCYWPYQYVILGAHQPLALMNFLLSFGLLLHARQRGLLYFSSGICAGLMLFSSPTAVLYLPYYGLLWLVGEKGAGRVTARNIFLFAAGAVLIGAGFTFPDPVDSLQQFQKFLSLSKFRNHFFVYAPLLAPYVPVKHLVDGSLVMGFRGAGWSWVIKYFFLVIPMIGIGYVLSVAFLLKAAAQRRSLRIFFIVLISFSTPWAVETMGAAQFGRNYFSALFGFLFLIAYAFHVWKTRAGGAGRWRATVVVRGIVLLLLGHCLFNAYAFGADVFPSRMTTARVYDWLVKRNVDHIAFYQDKDYVRETITARFLNNPKHAKKIRFEPMENICQVDEGYILVPPYSGATIWFNCLGEDFTADPYLNELVLSGMVRKFAVAAFPTVGSSKRWTQEEEVCSYRDLALGHFSQPHFDRSLVYILDAKKLQKEWTPCAGLKNIP